MKSAAVLALVLHLHAANGARLDGLAIQYHLIGPFGGIGSFVRTRPDESTYSIPLAYEGIPAASMKAIVYSPSTRFVLIERQRVSATDPLSITLEAQKAVTINGIAPIRGKGLVVAATYVAPWAMNYFGYLDGPVPTFDLGSAPLNADGSFSIALPQLSEDPIVRARDDKDDPSYFELIVRDAKGWNIRAHLELENGQKLLARNPLPSEIRCVTR